MAYTVYRAEWQSAVDGAWFDACDWTSEIAEAIEAQERFRARGYNTIIREEMIDENGRFI